eukprot:CAMPEP_0181231262 /NCGR_PEP_ID=MMETSP1096-20121128/34994_1 /TAXON_ID=156174 ORGANISM="Chrysochromulina ericina, Strain CCMP281" /NCGR_SAMPLE_ID=MMETSP1096 /ASSEMBLY_ACC=CAM_ASM_000453 /LENGTH=157 /DNA_ID=CAMNT_0023325255 /DNA_START=288 /DNA_END=758 /DNA_ORIENTATION=+
MEDEPIPTALITTAAVTTDDSTFCAPSSNPSEPTNAPSVAATAPSAPTFAACPASATFRPVLLICLHERAISNIERGISWRGDSLRSALTAEQVPVTEVINPGGSSPHKTEVAMKLIDGRSTTKWTDVSYNGTSTVYRRCGSSSGFHQVGRASSCHH